MPTAAPAQMPASDLLASPNTGVGVPASLGGESHQRSTQTVGLGLAHNVAVGLSLNQLECPEALNQITNVGTPLGMHLSQAIKDKI